LALRFEKTATGDLKKWSKHFRVCRAILECANAAPWSEGKQMSTRNVDICFPMTKKTPLAGQTEDVDIWDLKRSNRRSSRSEIHLEAPGLPLIQNQFLPGSSFQS
jgi:hypothetical protein